MTDYVTNFDLFGQTVYVKDEEAREQISTIGDSISAISEEVTSLTNRVNGISELPAAFDVKKYGDTSWLVTEFKSNKLHALPTNGNRNSPWLNPVDLYTFSKTSPYRLLFNGGLAAGCVLDGVLNTEYLNNTSAMYYLSLDNLNAIINKNIDASTLVNLGQNVIGIWSPIIQNHAAFNYSVLSDFESYESICLTKHERQVLAEMDDGSLRSYVCLDATPFDVGANYDDMIAFFTTENVKNAFNLDGGGSCAVVVDKVPTFPPANNTTYGRDNSICIGVEVYE